MQAKTLPSSEHPGVRPLIFAALATLLLSFIPVARFVTYPFLIFSTFVHETAHALAALLTAGSVDSLIVRWDGSGVTYTQGGIRMIVASAGYLGAAFFGGILLVISRNPGSVRPALLGCALLVATVTAIFAGHGNRFFIIACIGAITILISMSRTSMASKKTFALSGIALAVLGGLIGYLILTGSLFSWAAGLILSVALLGIFRFASLPTAHFFLSLLAIQCSFNALQAIYNLYSITVHGSCGNDAQTMASLTGIPALLWAIAWALIAVSILVVSLWLFAAKPKHKVSI